MKTKNDFNVAGIVVTFNPDINTLLQSIKEITQQVKVLIIIDNFSLNNIDITNVIKKFENIIFIQCESNVGLAEAQNIGINKAKLQNEITHIILFDQDSIINNQFIANLFCDEKRLIKQGYNVAAIGPSFIDPQTNKLYPATVYNGPFIKKIPLGSETIEATFIIASGSLIKIETLNKIGLMESDLFIDYIDVEWSLRAKSKGYKVFMSPNAIMQHTIGDKRISLLGRTISIHSPFRRYFLVRNSFYMLRLPYIPFGYKLREVTFNFARILIGVITSNQKKKFIKYTLLGLRDGILGKFGPCNYK